MSKHTIIVTPHNWAFLDKCREMGLSPFRATHYCGGFSNHHISGMIFEIGDVHLGYEWDKLGEKELWNILIRCRGKSFRYHKKLLGLSDYEVVR
jgi:hypothetical protein